MSAIVLGKRSSTFFEELSSPPSSSSSKRIRCSSSGSPSRFSPTRSVTADIGGVPALVTNLKLIFPGMDDELLQRALEASGYDLDSAIRSLSELQIRQTGDVLELSSNISVSEIDSRSLPNGDSSTSNLPGEENQQSNGADWVELFVGEMTRASNIDDARSRVSKALQILEQNIMARTSVDSAENFCMENKVLKEQVEVLARDNSILKRAVAIQHERQKEYELRDQELQHFKQLVADYQEQLRKLEINNYTLMMHLRQAQQSSSIPGHFHPDVF